MLNSTTRLGVTGPMRQYGGFVAKDAPAVVVQTGPHALTGIGGNSGGPFGASDPAIGFWGGWWRIRVELA